MNKLIQNYGLDSLQPAENFGIIPNQNFATYDYSGWLKLANCSFDDFTKVCDLSSYDLITNPPFTIDNTNEKLPEPISKPGMRKRYTQGQRPDIKNSLSKKSIELERTYQKLDGFLQSHKQTLGSVNILYPLKLTSKMYHYIAESDFSWSCVDTFDSGGFKLGFWECDKLLKSEKSMFLEYILSFLNRRVDLYGSEMETVLDILKKDLESSETKYVSYLGRKFREIFQSWNDGRVQDKTQTFSVRQKTKDEDVDATLSVSGEVEALIAKSGVQELQELSSVKQKEQGEYISGLQWQDKKQKEMILLHRRKRRNLYFKEALERNQARAQKAQESLEQKRKIKVQNLEKKLSEIGIDQKKIETLNTRIIKEQEKKKEKFQEKRDNSQGKNSNSTKRLPKW